MAHQDVGHIIGPWVQLRYGDAQARAPLRAAELRKRALQQRRQQLRGRAAHERARLRLPRRRVVQLLQQLGHRGLQHSLAARRTALSRAAAGKYACATAQVCTTFALCLIGLLP